jgi:hypothetical protein
MASIEAGMPALQAGDDRLHEVVSLDQVVRAYFAKHPADRHFWSDVAAAWLQARVDEFVGECVCKLLGHILRDDVELQQMFFAFQKRYQELKQLERDGAISDLELQVVDTNDGGSLWKLRYRTAEGAVVEG